MCGFRFFLRRFRSNLCNRFCRSRLRFDRDRLGWRRLRFGGRRRLCDFSGRRLCLGDGQLELGCSRDPLARDDRSTLDTLLDALGQSVEVPEEDLDAVTGLSGSGPAYVFEFAAALRDAGVAAGLTRSAAEKLAVETLLGSARLLARKQIEPETLRDQVTSPNGTTFAGLQRLQAGDFRGLIRDTVLAATARSRELSKDN